MSNNPVSRLMAAYERKWLHHDSLNAVLDYAKPLDGGGDAFILSGLYDLRSALQIVDELYRNYPLLTWRSLTTAAGTYHPLWGEPLDHKRFSKSVILPTHINQEKRDFKRGPTGENSTQAAVMVLPITHLWRHGYMPKAGDQVQYRTTLYEILAAHVDPNHYWQQSGFPLYVTCEMNIAPKDSRFLSCQDQGDSYESEDGVPVEREPDGPPMPTREPV